MRGRDLLNVSKDLIRSLRDRDLLNVSEDLARSLCEVGTYSMLARIS